VKVLTVRQPWAGLILAHGKDIENREWPTKVRGRIAIHSSKVLRVSDFDDARFVEHMGPKVDWTGPEFRAGCILGTVEIVDCVTASDSPWFVGPYGFVLSNPMLFERPIPAKGKLGFWEWEDVTGAGVAQGRNYE